MTRVATKELWFPYEVSCRSGTKRIFNEKTLTDHALGNRRIELRTAWTRVSYCVARPYFNGAAGYDRYDRVRRAGGHWSSGLARLPVSFFLVFNPTSRMYNNSQVRVVSCGAERTTDLAFLWTRAYLQSHINAVPRRRVPGRACIFVFRVIRKPWICTVLVVAFAEKTVLSRFRHTRMLRLYALVSYTIPFFQSPLIIPTVFLSNQRQRKNTKIKFGVGEKPFCLL